jgi:hypothetical protein
MYLRFWRLEQLVLRVQWARSLTAMISGLKLLEKLAPALENSVVNIPQVNIAQVNIAQANPGPTSGRLEIQPNKANDHVIEVLGKQG